MTRYRLVSPLGVYAPGTILDTDLPAGQMFSLQWQAAHRLAELGVVEPLEEPPLPQDEPGWTAEATAVQRENAADPAAAGRSGAHRHSARQKERTKR